MKSYMSVKKCIEKRNDKLLTVYSRESTFGYLRDVPTKNREMVKVQQYYSKKMKETSEEKKEGQATVTKTTKGDKWFKDELEMKRIYFDSTEEILEGLLQYEKVAEALNMDNEKR